MTFTGTLHPYQVEDKDYLLSRGKLMLGYGQGTGKTIMTIAALEEAMETGIVKEPGLIICLSSLKDQWAQAIHKWTGNQTQVLDPKTGLLSYAGGSSTPLVISGTPTQRKALYAQAMDWQQPGGPDYIILSFEQVVNDWVTVRKLPRGFVVVDESTFIKSFTSKRSRRVKRLDAPIKIALTGTPIDNAKPEELFSQMQWVDDTVLGRWELFDQAFIVRDGFGGVRRYRNIPLFIDTLRPAFRRRTKHDPEVAPYFPKTVEEKAPLVVSLDRANAKLYKHIATELAADLREAILTMSSFDLGSLYGFGQSKGDGVMGRIAQKRMALQMLVDHPHLLHVSSDKFDATMKGEGTGGSAYISQLVHDGLVPKTLGAPKMDAALSWLNGILEADPANKVVIFVTYVDTLRLLQERIKAGSVIFTGSMNDKQKAHAMATFKQDPDCRVFLSSDAGGYGVDLPEANYLLNYSFPEKWGTSDQRETRIVRADKRWEEVFIRRITVAGSIDVMKYNRLVMKGKVSEAFLDGKGIDSKGGLANDVSGLLTFITQGAGELCVT